MNGTMRNARHTLFGEGGGRERERVEDDNDIIFCAKESEFK